MACNVVKLLHWSRIYLGSMWICEDLVQKNLDFFTLGMAMDSFYKKPDFLNVCGLWNTVPPISVQYYVLVGITFCGSEFPLSVASVYKYRASPDLCLRPRKYCTAQLSAYYLFVGITFCGSEWPLSVASV